MVPSVAPATDDAAAPPSAPPPSDDRACPGPSSPPRAPAAPPTYHPSSAPPCLGSRIQKQANPEFVLPRDEAAVFCFLQPDALASRGGDWASRVACRGLDASNQLVSLAPNAGSATETALARVLSPYEAGGFRAPMTCESESGYDLRASVGGVLVCPKTEGACCRKVDVPALGAPRDVRLAISDDGSSLVVGRNFTKDHLRRNEVEVYDVATSRKLSSVTIPSDEEITQVTTLGPGVLVVRCVGAGPGCDGVLVHPRTGKSTKIPANLYGAHGACQRIDDSHWALVSVMDSAILYVDTNTGVADATSVKFDPKNTDVMNVSVTRRSDREIAAVTASPHAGAVLCFDLLAKKVIGRIEPARCP
jgi:hypothetical protein